MQKASAEEKSLKNRFTVATSRSVTVWVDLISMIASGIPGTLNIEYGQYNIYRPTVIWRYGPVFSGKRAMLPTLCFSSFQETEPSRNLLVIPDGGLIPLRFRLIGSFSNLIFHSKQVYIIYT